MEGVVKEKQQSSWQGQQERNRKLVGDSRYMREEIASAVLPLTLDVAGAPSLTDGVLRLAAQPFVECRVRGLAPDLGGAGPCRLSGVLGRLGRRLRSFARPLHEAHRRSLASLPVGGQ